MSVRIAAVVDVAIVAVVFVVVVADLFFVFTLAYSSSSSRQSGWCERSFIEVNNPNQNAGNETQISAENEPYNNTTTTTKISS